MAWDNRIATQYQVLAGQYVICLDADTGTTVWEHRYDWPYEPAGVYPGPRATPTYAAGFLYFASPHGLIGCLDAQSGKRVWQKHIYDEFGGDIGFGFSCSPTVIDGKVIVPVGGEGASLVAFDAATGAVVWKQGNEPASYTPAFPISFEGRQMVLGYLQNALVCHDLKTGEILWRRSLSAGYDEHSAWPLYKEPNLWISSPFTAGSELLQLTGQTDLPLKLRWQSKVMSNDIFSSVLHEGAIYGFDLRDAQAKTSRTSRGTFRCLDFLTGEELWAVGDDRPRRAQTDDKPWIGHATVLVADGKLILMNDLGELILAKANSKRFEQLGRASILAGELCWTQPSLHRGRLFLRNQSRAACVYLGEPELLNPQTLTAALSTSDIPQSQYVDWAGVVLGVEPEYAFDLPSPLWLGRWYAISLLGILGGSWLLASLLHVCCFRNRPSWHVRWVFYLLSFVGGALGTTLLSSWTQSFIFTWPVCIFAAFGMVVGETTSRSTTPGPSDLQRSASRPRAWLTLGVFLAVSLLYFLLCRRLSLVFEWVFLCGFAGAIPFFWLGQRWTAANRWSAWKEAVVAAAAFSGFYWFAAAVLWLR